MRLVKPSWVTHEEHPIFSLDIHPDGSRFATGGQGEDSGRVVVWNMSPVLSEEDEKDENVPKTLCQMDNHLACVNCVRWSNNGRYLASGGDDKVIMIWQTGRYANSSSVFGSGSGAKVNVEPWRCVNTLRGHSGDILDLAWSHHDTWLASCSVDNSIIIWNAQKMPEIVTVLRGHSGLVKGVAWDPVGKYLATQSDDKSLRVWRTLDWHQEALITEPFQECGGTTHVLRLCWSPDGQYLVSAHAMNNAGPTAQIIERDGWKTEKDFVGHRKAITCVRFNPNILSKVSKVAGKVHHHCCCAIGSRDRSLTIWLTALKRPLVVVHDLFTNSVLDISWSRMGDQMMACSWDGTVALLTFSEDEIGKSLSDDEKNSFYQKMYGKSFSTNHPNNNSYSTIIENPELLKLKEKQEKDQKKVQHVGEQQTSKVATGQAKGPLNRQIETRTADGKRRITPMYIAPEMEPGDLPQPFNSRTQPTFSSSTEKQSKIRIEKREESPTPLQQGTSASVAPPLSSPNVGGGGANSSSNNNEHHNNANTTAPISNGDVEPNKTVTLLPVPSSIVPSGSTCVSDSNHHSLKVPNHNAAATSETLKVTDKLKDVGSGGGVAYSKTKSGVVDVGRKDLVKPLVKRGPGRPPLSEKLAIQAAQQQQQQHQGHQQNNDAVSKNSTSTFHAGSDLHLPPLKPEKSSSVQISLGRSEGTMVLELENSVQATGSVVVHRLKCNRSDGNSWEVLLPAKGCAVAATRFMVCVVCEDSNLSIFSVHGRRLLPSLVLTSMASRITCSAQFVMVITSRGYVTVWDVKKECVLVKNESLLPIMSGASNDLTITSTSLTDKGAPVVTLSVGKSYTFATHMGCWMLIHNTEDILHQCSDHHSCLPPSTSASQGGNLPLAALQSHFKRGPQQAQRVFRSNPVMQQASTLCHVDGQLASALSLHSPAEVRLWMLTLARFLVQEGLEGRLRELCDYLLVSVSNSSLPSSARSNTTQVSQRPDLYIQGMHKHDLLKEILPIIGSNLRLQRLYTEYTEQLELIGT